jgi:predicted RNase H-like HicB family nuclease
MSCYGVDMAQALHPEFNLDVLLYRDDGEWVAHCLQLDLVEAGATPDEAEESLAGVIQHHIQWALEDDDMEHLFHPAPAEVWKKFFAAEPQGFREIPLSVPGDRVPAPPAVKVQRATVHAAA